VIAASILLVAVSQVDRVTEFSFAGAKAKLEQKIVEADEAIAHVRSLAAALAEPTMTMAMRLGRMGTTLTRLESLQLKKKIELTLETLGTPREEIQRVTSEYVRITLFDMSRPLMKLVDAALKPKVDQLHNAMKALGPHVTDVKAHSLAFEAWRTASKQRGEVMAVGDFNEISHLTANLEPALRYCPLLSREECADLLEKLRPYLEDMKYLQKHQQLRDEQAWLSSSDEE
jgi:hypothetical protein